MEHLRPVVECDAYGSLDDEDTEEPYCKRTMLFRESVKISYLLHDRESLDPVDEALAVPVDVDGIFLSESLHIGL